MPLVMLRSPLLLLVAHSCVRLTFGLAMLPVPQKGKLLCNCTEGSCNYSTGICETSGGCQKIVDMDLVTKVIRIGFSCIDEQTWEPSDRPIMCHVHAELGHKNKVGCCRNASFCASDLHLPLDIQKIGIEKSWNSNVIYFLVVLLCFLAGLLACGFVLILKRKSISIKRMFQSRHSTLERDGVNPLMNEEALESYQNIVNSAWAMVDPTSSGSGKGAALLVPRTIARQITLETIIGKGRFGEVWRGNWMGDYVAVKIFSARDEKSWFRELDIYQTALLHDDNLLKFIASDNRDDGMSTQLWLITQYHPSGSLYDYLMAKTVDPGQMCRMAQGVAAGLAFLHKEVVGTSLRPAIAHRDIKSKNVLVKNDGSCCLADLGLAVRYDSQKGTIDVPDNNKVGTRRYLAPEVLDETMNLNQFDSYRRSDIYSLGLVLWEICRRTDRGATVDPFELPYYEYVPADPSLEAMLQCVCVEQKRPTVPNKWYSYQLDNSLDRDEKLSEILQSFIRLMQECWSVNPETRLTALRVKKTLDQLLLKYDAATRPSAPHQALDHSCHHVTFNNNNMNINSNSNNNNSNVVMNDSNNNNHISNNVSRPACHDDVTTTLPAWSPVNVTATAQTRV